MPRRFFGTAAERVFQQWAALDETARGEFDILRKGAALAANRKPAEPKQQRTRKPKPEAGGAE